MSAEAVLPADAAPRAPGLRRWLVPTAVAAAFAGALVVRGRVGGLDQWMLPVLWVVRVAYVAALVLYLAALRWRTTRAASTALLVGFLASAFLVVTRGLEAGRWPSQSKFEVFFNTSMTLAGVMLLLSKGFGLARAQGRKRVAGSLVGTVVTGFAVTWVFIAGKEDFDVQELPPALQSLWFPPHVTSYMLGYSCVFSAALVAIVHLVAARIALRSALPTGPGTLVGDLDTFVARIVAVGLPLLTSGLFLGALWGEAAWADYWFWDIKETWAFVSWVSLLVYVHLRMVRGWAGTRTSLFALLSAGMVAVTYVAVQLLPAAISSEHVYN